VTVRLERSRRFRAEKSKDFKLAGNSTNTGESMQNFDDEISLRRLLDRSRSRWYIIYNRI
jgi:hypothetical protein